MPGIFWLPKEESISKSDEGSLVSGYLANGAKKSMSLISVNKLSSLNYLILLNYVSWNFHYDKFKSV